MTKKQNLELQELSIKVFGKKYGYLTLMRNGMVIGTDKKSGLPRRMSFTLEQTKQYMVKTIEMRAKLEEEQNEK